MHFVAVQANDERMWMLKEMHCRREMLRRDTLDMQDGIAVI